MALKTFKSYTKSTRGTVLVDKKNLWKGKPLKSLTVGSHSTGGRNNLGRITSRHKGAGHKQKYRQIDFYRKKDDIKAKIERIEYDPNRSAYVALIKYEDGEFRYIISPQKINIGDKVISSETAEIKEGNCLPLKNIPIGTSVHNIELKVGAGGQLARSAGSSVQIISKEDLYVQIRLASGEIRLINKNCLASVGVVSNVDNKNTKLGKAGRKRYLGFRPKVRGVVMNPVDHPHGGGEGRTSGGRHPVTPWGQPTKGKKTRTNKKTNTFILKRRKK